MPLNQAFADILFFDDFSAASPDWQQTGTQISVNTTSDEINWDGRRDAGNHGLSHDLGVGTLGNSWILRYKLDIQHLVNPSTLLGSPAILVGIGSNDHSTPALNPVWDAIQMHAQVVGVPQADTQFRSQWSNDGTLNAGGGNTVIGTEKPAVGIYYIETSRISDTVISTKIFSDPNFSVLIDSIDDTMTAGAVNNLRYIYVKTFDSENTPDGAFDGIIDDIELFIPTTTGVKEVWQYREQDYYYPSATISCFNTILNSSINGADIREGQPDCGDEQGIFYLFRSFPKSQIDGSSITVEWAGAVNVGNSVIELLVADGEYNASSFTDFPLGSGPLALPAFLPKGGGTLGYVFATNGAISPPAPATIFGFVNQTLSPSPAPCGVTICSSIDYSLSTEPKITVMIAISTNNIGLGDIEAQIKRIKISNIGTYDFRYSDLSGTNSIANENDFGEFNTLLIPTENVQTIIDTIYPTDATYNNGNAPFDSTVHNDDGYLVVESAAGYNNHDTRKIWLKFDLPVTQVTSATLSLYAVDGETLPTPTDVYFHNDNNWSEDTLTYNNEPAHFVGLTSGPHTTNTISTVNQYYDFDVTNLINTAGSSTVTMVLSNTDIEVNNAIAFTDETTSTPPVLVVQYESVDLTGLKAYYQFDESSDDLINLAGAVGSTDSLGSAADGIVDSSIVRNVPGIIDDAYEWNGVDSRVRMGTSTTQFNFLHDANAFWTINVWYKLDDVDGPFFYFASDASSDSTNHGIELSGFPANDLFIFRIRNFEGGGGGEVANSISNIPMPNDLNFHMLTVTYDQNAAPDNHIQFVLDGNVANKDILDKGGTAIPPTSADFPLHIGSRASTISPSILDGRLDEYSIWNRILTDDEIIALYNNGAGLDLGNQIPSATGTLKITKLTTGGDDTFDFTVSGPTSYNPSINTAGSGTISSNSGTYGSSADGEYFENNIQADFNQVTGILGNGVLQEGIELGDDNGEIRFGTNSQWDFLHTPVGSNIMSINLWFKGDLIDEADGGGSYSIVSTMNPAISDPDGFMFFVANENLRLNIMESGVDIESSNLNVDISGTNDGNWHMLTLAIDHSTDQDNPPFIPAIHACLDTVCEEEFRGMPFSGGGGTSSTTLTIGSQSSDDGEDFIESSFEVDDFTVWHGYNLTSADITALYNGGAGSSAGVSGSNIEPSFQVLHVTFDDTTGGGMGMDGPTPVDPGTYSIQEYIPAGWNLTTATCNDGSSSFSVDTVSGIIIGPGANIECTFEDELVSQGTLKITKLTTGGDDTFDFTVTGPTSYNPSINTGGGGGDLFNTLGLEDATSDLESFANNGNIGQLITLSNQRIASVRIENWDWSGPTEGNMTAKIWTGVSIGTGNEVEVATSPTVVFGTGNQIADFDGTFTFTTNPVLSGSDIVVGFVFTTEDEVPFPIITTDVGGNEGIFVGQQNPSPSLEPIAVTLGQSVGDVVDMESFRILGSFITAFNPNPVEFVSMEIRDINATLTNGGKLRAVIYNNVTDGNAFNTANLIATSDFINLASVQYANNPDIDVTFNFTSHAPVNDNDDLFIGLEYYDLNVNSNELFIPVLSTNISNFENLIAVENPDINDPWETSIFIDAISPNFPSTQVSPVVDQGLGFDFHYQTNYINTQPWITDPTGGGEVDVPMQVVLLGGGGGMGMDGPTPVDAGTYSVQEYIPAGWNLTTATCNDGSSSFSVDTVSGIIIGPGANIECTFENELSSPDTDGDGIYNEVDTLPTTFSDDFSDVSISGTSSGTITTRGDQILTITEEPNPSGVRIKADISGGTTKATVSVCGGIATIDLFPSSEIVVTCGSATIEVINGTVDITFISTEGTHGTTSLIAGNSITFNQDKFSFVAPLTNTQIISIDVEGTPITIGPGDTNSSDPEVGTVIVTPVPIYAGTLIAANATFTDLGPLETHTAVFDWGNQTTSAGNVSENGLSGTITGSHNYSKSGVYNGTLTVTDDTGNAGSIQFMVTVFPWTIQGFYHPVDMGGVVNTVKGGSTVPLKFEVFAGSIEKTSTSDISSFTQNSISCTTLLGHPEDAVEITTTGSTGLTYTSGQFHANWKTPKSPNTCWAVKVTTIDGTSISAFFKLK